MKRIITHFAFLLAALLMCLSEDYSQSVWLPQTSGTTKPIVDVWFTDANTGTAVGDGIILHTTDGGKTWTTKTVGAVLWGVRFSDSMNGWVVGANGVIMHTTNGGTSWGTQASGISNSLVSVFCLDANTAWVGGFNTILKTTNGGTTWTKKTMTNTVIWDIFFINADTGTAVAGWCASCWGNHTDGAFILNTTDGGNTWNVQETELTKYGLYAVFFTDANTGTIVGDGGTILRTTDGGATWTKQDSGTENDCWTENDLFGVFFTDSDTGTVVGGDSQAGVSYGGTMLRTTNGGTTWTKQEIPPSPNPRYAYALWDVFFTDANTGIAVGDKGTILRTEIEDTRKDEMAPDLSLSKNYPNPFNLSTNIKFKISDKNHVTLKVYTVNGQEIATLVDKELRQGSYDVTWDARSFPSGVYFYKLEVGSYVESRKIVLMR